MRNDKFNKLCQEEIELHDRKNNDYARGGDPLGNFKRVSRMLKEWGITLPPYAVAWVYLMKQIDAAGNMIGQDYNGEVEGIKGRLQDISVYAKLALILYEDDHPDTSTHTHPLLWEDIDLPSAKTIS